VFLDLRRNKYFALDDSEGGLLGRLFPALPDGDGELNEPSCSTTEAATDIADALVDTGLLTTDPRNGRQHALPQILPATRALMDQYLLSEIPIRPHHVQCLLSSWVTALLLLRRRGIDVIVQSVEKRNNERRASRSNSDLQHIAQLYTVFERLRPWLYTARDACLFDSLVLLEFLAHFGLSATWAFGVRTAPFGAHCWVQRDDVILNDTPEKAGRYTPILAV
jgi:hypothetical protein